jgi:hypothetical protein
MAELPKEKPTVSSAFFVGNNRLNEKEEFEHC